MSKMSRDKGGRGERAVIEKARDHGFIGVRTRSGGGQERSDIVGIPGIAMESKWVERESVRAWFDQVAANCGGDIPVVAHKRNHGPWLATLELDEFLALLKRAEQ